MKGSSQNIIITSVIGLMINLFSAYLFSLGLIDFNSIIFILAGFVIFIVITGFQSKINKIEINLEEQKLEFKKLNEELKNQEHLIDVKADIKELQRYLKNGKK